MGILLRRAWTPKSLSLVNGIPATIDPIGPFNASFNISPMRIPIHVRRCDGLGLFLAFVDLIVTSLAKYYAVIL